MKHIIITGCSSGMGLSAARYLVQNTNSTVIGIARREQQLHHFADELSAGHSKGTFIPVPFDLADLQSLPILVEKIRNHFSNVQILINNAGAFFKKTIEETSVNEFDHILNVNFKSPYFLIQHLLPMFSNPSHIVNITSMGGFHGSIKFPGLSVYSASKAALSNLTESLATELSDRGISVNAIAPGAVQTEMLSKAFPGFKAPVSPDEMGEFIANFALNGHTFFNGKILPASVSTP